MEHKYAGYRIELEFVKDKLNLHLVSDESRILKKYEDLSYEAGWLAHWIYQTRNTKGFNFGHVMLEKNKEVVVRTWAKKLLYVLKVEKYEVFCH